MHGCCSESNCAQRSRSVCNNKNVATSCLFETISFAFQLILVIMTRFLQTSIAQAVANGDPEGEAIGFLLPFGGKKGEEKKG